MTNEHWLATCLSKPALLLLSFASLQVFSWNPEHKLWQRHRQADHGGARRMYTKKGFLNLNTLHPSPCDVCTGSAQGPFPFLKPAWDTCKDHPLNDTMDKPYTRFTCEQMEAGQSWLVLFILDRVLSKSAYILHLTVCRSLKWLYMSRMTFPLPKQTRGLITSLFEHKEWE